MQPRFVEVEGLRVHSLVACEGPAIVLLPGLLDWAGRWADLGYIDSLANDFSVVAVEPLGMGESDRTTDPARLGYPSLIAQVVSVLEELDIDAAHLWGYSAGAQLAAAVAQAHPRRVRSLITGGQVPVFMATNAAQLEAQSQALLERGWDGYWSFTGDLRRPRFLPTARSRNGATTTRCSRRDSGAWRSPSGRGGRSEVRNSATSGPSSRGSSTPVRG